MANTFKFGNGKWATGEGTVLAYNDENNNFKPLPFDFTRASTATYVDSDGLIKTAGNGEPRIDYTNNTDGALLLEPSRTNAALQSNKFDTTWINNNTAETSGQVGVGGSTDAWLLNKSAAYGYIKQDLSSSGVQTLSVFAKKGSLNWIRIIATGGTSVPSTWFDLENGVVGDADFFTVSSSIENYGNGWYRCSITIDVGTITGIRYYPSVDNNNVSGTSGNIYIQYAQLEQGSYATSYIPTSGSSVTRVEETCNGAGNSEVFNDTKGVIFVETEPFIDGDFESQYISLSDGTSGNEFVSIQHRNSGQLRVYAGGFGTENIQFLVNLDMAQNLKIAVQYKESDYKLFVNGTEYSIYSSGGNQPSLSGLSQLDFNIGGGTSQKWKAKTKQVKIYNTTLSDAELQALTQ